MTLTVCVPVTLTAVVRELEDGSFYAEVPHLPGCLTYAETSDELETNIILAVQDWLSETSDKSEEEARRLAKLQGSDVLPDEVYPQPYSFSPPPGWTEDDE